MFRLWSVFLAVAVSLAVADIRLLNRDRRLIGGEPTTIEEHPYAVSIEILGSHTGGGAILSEKFVITAAYILPPATSKVKRLTVVAGSTYRLHKKRSSYISSKWIHFPNYNTNTNDKDVGIIIVDDPIKFGPAIQPIQLVTLKEHPKHGDMLTISGWGSIEPETGLDLQAVTIPLLNQNMCRASIKDAQYHFTDSMMCAGRVKELKTAGPLDIGGPAVTKSKKLAGIISWRKHWHIDMTPLILTDVTSPPIADFIKAVINGTITKDVL